ncbi:Ribosomal RNA small subunit methyltransferase J [Buchnera aphidicola (Periphyllus testudinaceus)]|uniref:class I SAM-dependent methyltransferase n=1 Tax=Buchnera aphidicola TaxID=9 RepID=UPI003463FF7C
MIFIKNKYKIILLKKKNVLKLYRINLIKNKTMESIFIDFLSGTYNFRRKYNKQKELIIKAMRTKSKKNITILDSTAGFGKDSFVLASFGFKVFMIEKNLIIYKLLSNGLKRAYTDQKIGKWIKKRMILFHSDSLIFFKKRKIIPDIIYIDPMFNKKKSKPKKDMFLLKKLLKNTNNEEKLLKPAIKLAKKKVVVKRYLNQSFLKKKKPNYILYGKNYRFDIYNT